MNSILAFKMQPIVLGFGDQIAEWCKDNIENMINDMDLVQYVDKYANENFGLIGSGGTAEMFSDSLAPVGLMICALFFIMSLLDKSMSDNFSIEQFGKMFLYLCMGVFAVGYSWDFCQLGMGISEWVSDLISNVSEGASKASLNTALDEINANAFEWLQMLLSIGLLSFIGSIASIIAAVAMIIILFTRLVELTLRSILMPIAVAFIAEDGWKGASLRYIKKFIALCIQGPILVITCNFQRMMLSSVVESWSNQADLNIFNDFSMLLIASLGATFAVVGVSMKSIGLINDAMGV